MSPIPLIARQRALSRIGEIRLGDEKHDGKVGRKLETFRLTSQHKEVIDEAARLYGGTVTTWESPTGSAWQVITERSSLPVLVIPGYSLRRSYEKWAGPSKRERVCDGEEMSDGAECICNAQGKDECKLLTRLMVLLPETGTSLGWQLSSTGETAADELALGMKIAEQLAFNGWTSETASFVPATLSITQRKGQKDGSATRFVVPVLSFDPRRPNLAAGELPAGDVLTPSALPAGYTPIAPAPGNGTSLEAGLKAAETQVLTKKPRVELPEDDVEDEVVVSSDKKITAEDAAAFQKEWADAKPLNMRETKAKLNALVGQLREGGHITTLQLYAALAKARNVDVDTMTELLEGAWGTDGELHWGPLRDSLTLEEARELHGRLAKLWVNVQQEVPA